MKRQKGPACRQAGFAPILVIIAVALAALVILKPSLPNLKPEVSSPLQIPVAEAQVDQSKLQKYLTVEAALLGVSDNVSLYYKDLNLDKVVSIDPERSWIPASTIKSYVVMEAFRQRDLGLINFNQTVAIKASNVVPTELETDDFPRLREGTTATIKQLVEAMVTQSDNTAYNTLIDILDRRNINLGLKNIGLTETVVGEKLNLDDSQFQEDLGAAGRQPNTTTVKDLAAFFDLLYKNKIPDSKEILDIFKKQKINNMIPALLPKETAVAHKTGDWAPIYHDGGVIYRGSDPFVLSVFTSADDPGVVAQIARVAYYQSSKVVGKDLNDKTPITLALPRPVVSVKIVSNVLAEETGKFPTITASDLGITAKDLGASRSVNVQEAIVTSDSILYPLKRKIEQFRIDHSSSNARKAEAYLASSKDRIAEVKSLIARGELEKADTALKDSERSLAAAVELAQHDPDRDQLLLEIKQVNDIQFSSLAQKAASVSDTQKEAFIDSVYNFTEKNKQEVKLVANTSVIANPLQQKPAVGTINDIQDNKATVTFDDGSKKEIVLPNDTKVRDFQKDNYQAISSLKSGDKVAIVGLTNSRSQIVPQFILKSLPKELPSEHTGTVIEINPNSKTLEILDKKGNISVVQIDNKTTIRSSDTGVSLEGIKAGSVVSVFGITDKVSTSLDGTASASLRPDFKTNPSPAASAIPNSAVGQSSGQSTGQSVGQSAAGPQGKSVTNTPAAPSAQIKATSVTVTVNSSGKNEQSSKQEKKPEPPKQEKGKK